MLQSNHLTFNSFISYSSDFYIFIQCFACQGHAPPLQFNSTLFLCRSIPCVAQPRLGFSVCFYAVASQISAKLCLCFTRLFYSQRFHCISFLHAAVQCLSIPWHFISVLCISLASPGTAPLCHRKASPANLLRFTRNNFYYRTGNS